MKWTIVLASYIVWNVCAYSAKMLFGLDRALYDKIYWVNERIFVLVVFLTLLSYVQKQYKWAIRAMILVASFKLVYILLVIMNLIKPNDFASLMGVFFMVVLGVVTIRWEKRQK